MTELQKIAQRIARHEAAIARDRERQKVLIARRILDEGRTWNEVELEADVSRPTINRTIRAARAERDEAPAA